MIQLLNPMDESARMMINQIRLTDDFIESAVTSFQERSSKVRKSLLKDHFSIKGGSKTII